MPSLQWIGKGERKKDRTRTPKPWQLHGPIISACLFFNLQFALKTNFDRQIFDAPTTSKDDVMWCGRKVREKKICAHVNEGKRNGKRQSICLKNETMKIMMNYGTLRCKRLSLAFNTSTLTAFTTDFHYSHFYPCGFPPHKYLSYS